MAKNHQPLPLIISAAYAGGQGKTTLAQLLYLSARRAGYQPRLFAADFQDETGRSKIGKLYPDRVVELGTGAELIAARRENNPNAAVRYWDKAGNLFLEGNAIIDVGANVFQSLVEWGVDRNVASLMEKRNAPKIELFCVTRAQRHGLDNIANLIQQVTKSKPFRLGRIVVVQNEAGGDFSGLDMEGELRARFPEAELTFVRLPACQAEIWPALERSGVSIETVLDSDEDALTTLLGVDLWTASSGLAEIRTWFDFVNQQLKLSEPIMRRDLRLAAAAAS